MCFAKRLDALLDQVKNVAVLGVICQAIINGCNAVG
jgi:hypothetical protein